MVHKYAIPEVKELNWKTVWLRGFKHFEDQFLIRSNWDRYSFYFSKKTQKIKSLKFSEKIIGVYSVVVEMIDFKLKGGFLIFLKIYQPFLTKFSLHVIRAGFLRIQFWNSNCVWSRGRSQLSRGIIYTKMVKSEYWRSLCGRKLKIKLFRI